MTQTVIHVQGMDCSGCAPPLAMALQLVKGVKKADVDYRAGTATVDHDPSQAPIPRLILAVTQMGYTARVA